MNDISLVDHFCLQHVIQPNGLRVGVDFYYKVLFNEMLKTI